MSQLFGALPAFAFPEVSRRRTRPGRPANTAGLPGSAIYQKILKTIKEIMIVSMILETQKVIKMLKLLCTTE